MPIIWAFFFYWIFIEKTHKMKIIVNERQYNLIKEFIEEANKTKLSKDKMAKLGKDIINILENIGQGMTTEFLLGSGNKVILKCVSDDNYVFKFEIVEDSSKALKKWDLLQIKINPGNGETEGTTREYNINKDIIEMSKNGNGFTLIFNAFKKTGLKGTVKLNNITKVGPSSVKPEEPQQQEPKPEEPTSGDTKTEKTDKLKEKGEVAFERIKNDPLLKKAFYEQPGFLKLLAAELTGKQAVGKGIISVLGILQKYDRKKIKELFIQTKKVTVKFNKNYVVKYGKNDEYSQSFNLNEEYLTTVLKYELGKGIKLRFDKTFTFDSPNTIGLILTLTDIEDELEDKFYGELSFYVKEGQEKVRYIVDETINITVIRGEKSLGYKATEKNK